MADVAARADVSRTAASYVLNGRAEEMRLSAGTVDRVQRAVVALGYRRNRTALSLRTAETRVLGLVSDHVASGHFASAMLSGASAAARDLDHLLVIGESDGDPLLERSLVDQLLDRGVDGIVYAALRHREVTVPAALGQVPTVLLNCVDAGGRLGAVVPDERGGGRSAARLLDGVADEVVVLGDDREQGTRAGSLRLAGVVEGLAAAGRGAPSVVRCDWTVASARAALAQRLRRGGRPGAVVCLNDRVGMGAYQALAARGLAVPDDVAVVSFDGSELASWLQPPLTSVGLPFAELGALAVRRVLRPEGPGDGVDEVAMAVVVGGSLPQAARSAVRRTASAKTGQSARGRS